MTHQMIRRFCLVGDLIETRMIQARDTHHSVLLNMMRDEGYVPLLDVNPVFLTNYRGGEKYEFSYTMQGVYVGRDTAWESVGMIDGKLIPSTPKSK